MKQTVRVPMAQRSGHVATVFFCALAVLVLIQAVAAADIAVLNNGFTIRHDHRVVMGETTRLYLSADNSSFTDVPTAEITNFEKDLSASTNPAPSPDAAATAGISPGGSALQSNSGPYVSTRSAADLMQVVNSASAAYHLDPDLVNSVIHAESGFNARAISPKGAQGLMQLMPSTANELGVTNAFDPQANVGGGSHYLRELLERYNFDLIKALAAYNAGPQRVEQYRGIPPYYETRTYVARVVHDYNRKKIAQERAAAEAEKSARTAAEKKTTASSTGRKIASPKPVHTASGSAKSAAPIASSSVASNSSH